MDLQPLTIEDIPFGVPLPWEILDARGTTAFAQGDVIADRKMIEQVLAGGLSRSVGASPYVFPPDGIKPQAGEVLQLRLLRNGIKARYYAHLIGYIKDKSILITTPEISGQRIDMSEGEMVEVQMLVGRNIYIFETDVMGVRFRPLHYLHLTYPGAVRVQEFRKSPWAKVNLAASVSNMQGKKELACITNISHDGALLQVPVEMGKQGEALSLVFTVGIDELKNPLELDVEIRRVRCLNQPANGSRARAMIEHGVEFRQLAPEATLWLKCLVFQRIAEGYLI